MLQSQFLIYVIDMSRTCLDMIFSSYVLKQTNQKSKKKIHLGILSYSRDETNLIEY